MHRWSTCGRAGAALVIALALCRTHGPPTAPEPVDPPGTWTTVALPLLRTLDRGVAPIAAIGFSPDGTLLAAACTDGVVVLWNTRTGGLGGTLQPVWLGSDPDRTPLAVAFSHSGATVAVAAFDGTVTAWDVASARRLRGAPNHGFAATTLAFAPTGTLVATGYADGGLLLWDTRDGRERRVLPRQEGMVLDMAFAPGGTILATAGWYRSVVLWEVATGRVVRTLADEAPVWAVAYSPDGTMLAAGGERAVVVWDLGRGVPVRRLAASATVRALTFVGASTLTAAASDGTVRSWDVGTGHVVHAGRIESTPARVALSPRRGLLAATAVDESWNLAATTTSEVRLWDARPGGEDRVPPGRRSPSR